GASVLAYSAPDEERAGSRSWMAGCGARLRRRRGGERDTWLLRREPARPPLELGARGRGGRVLRRSHSGCDRPGVYRVSRHDTEGAADGDRDGDDRGGSAALPSDGFDAVRGLGAESRAVRRGSLNCLPILRWRQTNWGGSPRPLSSGDQ